MVRGILLFISLVILAGCANKTIIHDLSEREANQIIELLAENQIEAQKLRIDTGRDFVYNISVPAKMRIDAIAVLNFHEQPMRRDRGYNEIYLETSLIPTSSEERSRALSALEGEIERQLKLVSGILDVQVQVVVPEENVLRTNEEVEPPTTASVTVKYLSGAGGTKPLSEPQVQAVVAAGVLKLNPENVVVIMTPAAMGSSRDASVGQRSIDRQAYGLKKLSPKQLNVLAALMIALVLVLSLVLFYWQMRLKTVRGRLTRLQNEIAKARNRQSQSQPDELLSP